MRLLKYILFIALCYVSHSQSQLSGTISTTKNQPIFNANVLAVPVDKNEKLVFTTTDEKGYYKIYLTDGKQYKLTFSHISHINNNIDLLFEKTKNTLNVTLDDSLNELEEVTITQQAPITIKKDTTTYRASAFSNGKERKLRELLKKLPGVEVDKKGDVTVKGKKITEFLVDGKQFFNGDTKLGVNNIPANAASEIEIIEDYHKTSFLKGLENSEEIAMNIKLRDDKKQFVFGDIEAAGGINNRYKLHPKIFKYAPKLSINFIGDINNTFDKSFTLSDYINFEGGSKFDQFFNTNLFNSNLFNLLRNDDYKSNKHKFAGFSSQYNPNDKNQFKVYTIALNDDSDFTNQNTIDYFNDIPNEIRNQNENNTTDLFLTKLSYKNTPNNNTVLNTDITIEATNVNAITTSTSTFFNNNLPFTNTTKNKTFKINGNFNLDKKHNAKHVTVVNAKLNINSDDNNTLFNSNTNVFSDEIPLVDDAIFNVVKNQNNDVNIISVFGNHYWIINRKNHLYVKIGNSFNQNDFNSLDFQRLSSNQNNTLTDFSNNLNSKYNQFYNQLTYKRIIGNIIAEFKLRYENQNINNIQEETKTIINNNNIIPELGINWDINSKNEVVFKYKKGFNYKPFSSYATGRIIRGFRGVFEGNKDLDQITSQNLSLSYAYRKSYGLSIYSTLNYRKNSDIVLNDYQLFTIFSLTTPVQLNENNEFYNASLRLSFNKPYWNIKYNLRYSNSKLSNIFNSEILKSKQNSYNNNLDFSTKFEENPNVRIGIDYNLGFNENQNLNNKQTRFKVETTLSYDYKDWKFNTNYTYTSFKNEASFNSLSKFDDLNASIFYNKEDSRWSFEIKAHNITNNKSTVFNSFNQISIDESKTFVFPRYVLFGITYKL